ncbi:Myb-like DNA-binding domain containing protein [Tritrichomonas foetus]|uniref:Myb-like DNA-binding domain containing protein n=1 Tax=Tritrichomonas foetus TaxID=1144522 RepID=A0A1J4JJY7_9EUKA|nr:Myb-like DNA-binding domain containing protein [Tritrichomonas foetus]|eukprot:OHS97564.1 Myb-like DNA-binding domain containing protein [Tritrichomonas foetus]
MDGRSARACRERWRLFLSPGLTNGPWSHAEDALLIKLFNEHGPKWKTLSTYFNGRSECNIKNRWTRHLKQMLSDSTFSEPTTIGSTIEKTMESTIRSTIADENNYSAENKPQPIPTLQEIQNADPFEEEIGGTLAPPAAKKECDEMGDISLEVFHLNGDDIFEEPGFFEPTFQFNEFLW